MNRKILHLLIIILLTAACSKVEDSAFMPKIPKHNSLPKIPRSLELKASVLETNKEPHPGSDLYQVVSDGIENQNITTNDLERGFYKAKEHEKRYGTPDNWLWVDQGDNSMWIRPGTVIVNPFEVAAKLCADSGGIYQYSCYDFKHPQCEYRGNSRCECSKETVWLESEGCIAVDDLNEMRKITETELNQGYYFGQKNEKKKGTPPHWVWIDQDEKSLWQNAPPPE